MERFLAKYSDYLYAILRIIAGLLFTCHGAQKVFGALGGHAAPLLSRTGAAGVIELVAGILIAVGLFTSYAAFLSSGEMAFAYFIQHAPQGFWPIQNRGELAILFCFIFLYVASRGTVRWGLGR